MRHTHKLRALPKTQKEIVLCTGKPDRFCVVRYFWKNVSCKMCLALKGKKTPGGK